MLPRLLTCLLLAALPVSALSAQGLELPPPPKPVPEQGGGDKDPKKEKEQGEGEEQPAEATEATAEVPKLWEDASGRAEEIFRDFEMARRDTDVVHKRTLNELRDLGLNTKDAALKALNSTYPPTVVIAAELLEWVGDPEDAEKIVAASFQAPDTTSVNACLTCAMKLGNGKLPANAVKLLDHPRRPVRTLAEARLGEAKSADYLPKLLQFLNYGRDKDLKLRAARLLAQYPEREEVREGLRKTLAGDSVEIAMVAIHTLQGEGSEEDIAWMEKELLVAQTTLEAGYLAFGLVELQDQRPELILNPGLESRLRFLLDDKDLFVSGAAAAALAELAFRIDLVGSQAELDRKLPLFLVRAVGGVIFYPQYATFAPLAERSLRRITGEDFRGEDGSAWIRWLQANQEGFRLVRGRLDVNAETVSRLRVAWNDREGVPPHVLVGPEAAWNYGDRVLGLQDLARLQRALEDAHLLDASVLPGTYGLPEAALAASFDISMGAQRKTVKYRGRAGSGKVQPLLALLTELDHKTAWQSLASRDELGHQFVLEHLEEFDQLGPGEARNAALLGLMRDRLSSLDPESLRNWVAELRNMPDLSGVWSDDLAQDFFAVALREAPADPLFAVRILDLALTSPQADRLPANIDAIMALEPPASGILLEAAFTHYAPADLAAALQDQRSPVRVAAVTALATAESAEAPALLRQALADNDPQVQQLALRGLGRLASADEETYQALLAFAQPGQVNALRNEALWGLGRLGRPEAVATLVEAALDSEMTVQVAGLDALGRVGGREADNALSQLFASFADSPLESSYLRAVMGGGASRARGILRPNLLAEDPLVSNRAAVLSGSLGDPAAAPSLMAMLPSNPRDAELLEALATTLCTDFRRLPDPAGTYTAWWEKNRAASPALWLQKPAADAGYALSPAFIDPERVSTRTSAAILLDLLVNGPTWMRPAAAYYLEALSGRDAPVILARTPKAEVQRRAAVWQDWLKQ